ncbi:NAD-dependent epimerase/dehydratase family protein [Desertihabitans brevis]|uniref:dTDP-4-dehydrorhamnose reductase n=1 Tax=Desertihabitans brevis TaxID=2268447 RepID=A0A367YTX7_9ACTN|nr:bifunctional dTDP-4-dehydrorhamnose 3,5-epimerase family protein/NAD(P)-dependent oxidoreductase [Desertihabitans brevis]RCK69268.1 NAD-dependent epimerase/dehydratase family protein [Desertihabitans brevis]
MAELAVETTAIDGLLVLRLPVHGDARGWFKESWQREKMVALGLPDFAPVQNNVSFNAEVGVTRGIHAEPWDKLVTVTTGRVFGAWVDLRAGDGFGRSVTLEIDPGTAVYVPRGVGNGFQTLEPATAYSYLVNDHWSAAAQDRYTFLDLADETVALPWPVPPEQRIVSDKDRTHPPLSAVTPVEPLQTVVLGGNGQLGRALAARLPGARVLTRAELDLAEPQAVTRLDLTGVGTVINAAAMTDVDGAETPQGRRLAWQVNATAVADLAAACRRHRATLVHVSTDYVFDGTTAVADETTPVAPLGVYGQSKAAGELAVGALDRHYLVRTSWVVGEGRNFVATMESLAARGISPSVVDDQRGRLTHTTTLAAGILHLLDTSAPYGTYHLTDGGEPVTWADVARAVFVRCGRDADDVTPVSTATYFGDKPHAPRPASSVLDLTKIRGTGFSPPVVAP